MVLILSPSLTKTKQEAILDKVKGLLGDEGKVEKVEEWGKREFAYPIDRETQGSYFLLQLIANPKLGKKIEETLRIEEGVLRHLLLRE